jgi:hypothetical protein
MIRISAAIFALLTLATPVSAAVLLDQLSPPLDGIPSQRSGPLFVNFDSGVVDDFTLTQDASLTSVSALILEGNAAAVSNWNVEIYSGLTAAATSLTGDVASVSIAPLSAVIDAFPGFDRVTLPVAINLAAGTYWLAVIGDLEIDRFGQLFVGISGGGNAYLTNPGGGFGYTGNLESWGRNATYRIEGNLIGAVVPEPASWAMLIAGFGLVGATLRRRRMAKRLA